MTSNLPIAIIGAGPVGLAAAAQLEARGLPFRIFEKGETVGAALNEWAHVRVFSPWQYDIDATAKALLQRHGWDAPEDTDLPTGGEIVARYLSPLSELPEIAPHLRLGASVTAITRKGLDKMSNANRDNTPFEIRWSDASGAEHRELASGVIDASGTWSKPNPMGVDGLHVPGERAAIDRIAYGIPDAVGNERKTYAGKRTLVVGSGHSAINAALALLALQDQEPSTKVIWALRKNSIDKLLGGGVNDQLPERGALGIAAKKAIDTGRLQMLAPFTASNIDRTENGLRVDAEVGGLPFSLEVDRIIVATGFRPDTSLFSELRVSLEPAVEATPALAPLIDPNFHSCGTVPPHGVDELAHPEPGFYIVGSKSYGRAPTFLMATGFEQVRSIAAEFAGDPIAAREVHLVLPETGVCSASSVFGESAGCCGGPASSTSSCCVADEVAKEEGASSCGCGSSASAASTPKVSEPA